MDPEKLQLLREILGGQLQDREGQQLLRDSEGCVETAVAMYFSQQAVAERTSTPPRASGSQPRGRRNSSGRTGKKNILFWLSKPSACSSGD